MFYLITYSLCIFITGLILSTGTAAVAKAMSNYCDSLLGNPQRKYMLEHFPIHISFLADYPDIASFTVIVIISRKFI